jgi:hypothetical protein
MHVIKIIKIPDSQHSVGTECPMLYDKTLSITLAPPAKTAQNLSQSFALSIYKGLLKQRTVLLYHLAGTLCFLLLCLPLTFNKLYYHHWRVEGGGVPGFLSFLGLGISSQDTKSAHTGRFIRDRKGCS